MFVSDGMFAPIGSPLMRLMTRVVLCEGPITFAPIGSVQSTLKKILGWVATLRELD
jgi:hypothetical protein